MDLSIVILAFRSKRDLERLLPSIERSVGMEFNNNHNDNGYTAEVIVVDNGSNDGTAEWVQEHISKSVNKHISFIQNANTGFAHGNNLGIRQASGKYILLLNPDTEVRPETFKVMLDFMENRPDVGIAGCKLIKPDGSLDLACRRRFPNPWNSFKRLFLLDRSGYNYTNIDENQEMEVDSVVGAFLMIRREVMDKIGLLDEAFFMYGEDLDWCWRCKEAGYKVWYYPKTTIAHYKGESSRKIPFHALKWFHDAMWVFYRKHYAEQYPFLFNWAVWIGIYSRMAALIVLNTLKGKPRVSG